MAVASTLHLKKKWSDKIADTNYQLFTEYYNHSQFFHQNAKKMEDARFMKQFSKAEEQELLKFRQAPIPISISTAILDTADAALVSANPVVHVSPVINPLNEEKTENSKKVAQLYRHLIQSSWYNALGSLQYDRCIHDASNVGRGLIYVIPRNEAGEFTVDFKHLSWRYYFPDPSSRNPLYDDMDAMVYAMPISIKSAYKFVKSIEPDITLERFKKEFVKGAETPTNFYEDTTFTQGRDYQNSILFVQRLTLEDEEVHYIIPTERIGEDDQDYLKFQSYTVLPDEVKELEKQGKVRIETKSKLYLTEYTSIGNYGYKVVYPISRYNIIPINYRHRDTPYPYSRMWELYPLQRALNRYFMSAILNMSLLNTTKIFAEENSIVNLKQWTQSASMPNAILRYRLPVPGVSKPPEIIKPTPMDQAWLIFPKYIISMMEYISGIFAPLQGNPEGSSDVFSTVATLQSAGSQKLKSLMQSADAALSVAGKVAGEFYKNYAPINGYTSILHTNTKSGKPEEEIIFYNQAKPEVEIKDGKVTADLKLKPERNLRIGFRDVRFTTQKSTGYEASTEAAMLTTLATQLGVPDLVPLILERINIPGSQKIVEKMENRGKIQEQVQQLQNRNQELESSLKSREQQIFQLAKTLEAEKFKGQLSTELEQFKNNPMEYIKKSTNMQGER